MVTPMTIPKRMSTATIPSTAPPVIAIAMPADPSQRLAAGQERRCGRTADCAGPSRSRSPAPVFDPVLVREVLVDHIAPDCQVTL